LTNKLKIITNNLLIHFLFLEFLNLFILYIKKKKIFFLIILFTSTIYFSPQISSPLNNFFFILTKNFTRATFSIESNSFYFTQFVFSFFRLGFFISNYFISEFKIKWGKSFRGSIFFWLKGEKKKKIFFKL
jgi:hypothetical protein